MVLHSPYSLHLVTVLAGRPLLTRTPCASAGAGTAAIASGLRTDSPNRRGSSFIFTKLNGFKCGFTSPSIISTELLEVFSCLSDNLLEVL